MIPVRLFHWAYYRATGDIWSPSMRWVLMRPTLRWVLTGRVGDTAGPTFADAVVDGVREAEIQHLREQVETLEERHELDVDFMHDIGRALGEQEGEDVLTAAERVTRELAGARETIGHLQDEIELMRRAD